MEDWTTKTGAELGKAVVDVGRALWTNNASRRARMLSCIRRYEGRNLLSLDPRAYADAKDLRADGPEDELIRWNLCRTLSDTVVAKIGGTQQPKIAVMSSNADWSTRRKGPKLEAFISGLWAQPQDPYTDIWELGLAAIRDAVICGIGFVKVWSDIDAGRVLHERVFPWEILVDPHDARYGVPSNLFHVTAIPRATLVALFPEAAEALRYAKTGLVGEDDTVPVFETDSVMSAPHVAELVRIYEWWQLPLSTDVPGHHVMAFDGGVLIDEEWTRSTFPVAAIRWSREFQGWHGRSLVEEVEHIDDQMNDLLARIVRTVRLTGMGRAYLHEDDTTSEISNEDATVVRYSGPTPPQYESPEPISPTHVSLLQLLKSSAYEFTGVNQMAATAQKQPGIVAAEAIRNLADLQSERFAPLWKAYQSLFVEIARLDVACVRELANEKKDFAVKWPGAGFLRSIPWASVDLDDDMFVIQIAAAPGVKGSPADRLQTAQELYGAGQLSADALMAVRNYLDLPGELEKASRQRNLIEQYIEQWLDATPEQIETMRLEDGSPLVRPPLRWMRLEDALLQVVDAYLQAELDGAPDDVKDLFIRWIEMADSEIQKRQQRLAALQAPPPPPPGPPGAPAPMPAGGPAV